MRYDILSDRALFLEAILADVFLATAHVDAREGILLVVGLVLEVGVGSEVDHAVFTCLPCRGHSRDAILTAESLNKVDLVDAARGTGEPALPDEVKGAVAHTAILTCCHHLREVIQAIDTIRVTLVLDMALIATTWC